MVSALRAMLEAKSVAIVGASARQGSFGSRMLAEVGRSAAKPVTYPVNPRYRDIDGNPCYPSLAELPGPVDLVLLGVPDAAIEGQLRLAAELGCRSAVVFGNAYESVPSDPVAGTPPDSAPAGHPSTFCQRPAATPPGIPPAGHPSTFCQRPAATPPGIPPAGHPSTLRERLAMIALSAGMELCGAACMGFANVTYGLRAMGYIEPDPIPSGPVALVTHSGSVFSAMLRARRGFGFTLAVSSGQELVTAAPAYLAYALDQPDTKVLALVLEAIRRPGELRAVLAAAAGRGLPVVLLTAGQSASGRAMVAAHSGALAGSDGGWEALTREYGLHRVADLAEMSDTLELLALRTRRPRAVPNSSYGALLLPERQQCSIAVAVAAGDARPIDGVRPVRGIATVHDSGLERAHTADLADQLGVPFASISEATKARLARLLDPGLLPANPLDVWGTGASTRKLFAESLLALADDAAVGIVALAVDLVTELDGDDSYPLALLDAAERTGKPLAVISNVPSAIDPRAAERLRRAGIGVLEGMRSGLLALRHLLDQQARGFDHGSADQRGATALASGSVVAGRLDRARKLLARCDQTGAAQLELLREYGIGVTRVERAASSDEAVAAATRIGYPVVLKTDQPGIAHKSDSRAVVLGLTDAAGVAAAYADVAGRLGPAVLVCQTAPPGVELALGIVRDPDLGPLIVVGAGGTLVELLADRAVAFPPRTQEQAVGLLDGLKVTALLDGVRGARPADRRAIIAALAGLAGLADELGEHVDAIDINPVICGPHGAIAVDALIIPRST